MGQAKARGTKDQRVAEGECKAKDKIAKERIARQAYLKSLIPEEREKINKGRMLLASMLGCLVSTGHSR